MQGPFEPARGSKPILFDKFNRYSGSGVIRTLGVFIRNTKMCQLSYKALGKPIFPSSTFSSNLAIT